MLYFGLFVLFCFCTFHAVLTPAHGVYTSKKELHTSFIYLFIYSPVKWTGF